VNHNEALLDIAMDLGFCSLKRPVGLVLVEDLTEKALIGAFGDTDLFVDHGEDSGHLELQEVQGGLIVFELLMRG
jgi:hypothetical protein